MTDERESMEETHDPPAEHYDERGAAVEETDEYRERLGDILISEGLISPAMLATALAVQRESPMKLGEILLRYRYVTEEGLCVALCRQHGKRYLGAIDLRTFDPTVLALIPERVIREQQVVPFEREGSVLRIITIDPTNLFLLDDVRMITGFQDLEVLLTTPTFMKKALTDFYEVEQTMTSLLGEMDEDDFEVVEDAGEAVSMAELRAQVEDTPIIRMVNLIIKEAMQIKATDIHLEPYEHVFRVRYRVDGILREAPSPPKKFQGAILSRIKIMADLDIAERRLPQDGRFKLRLGHKEIDFRISTLPTVFGEKIAMRLLDKTSRIQEKTGTIADLEHLGFSEDQRQIIQRAIFAPYGMIIVAGPTGSGKSTTLYACLEILNDAAKNIVTVEDPVEYMIPGVNQVAARPQIGLNFASALRSILRQDPDIMMIGEIRDQETASIAINAALTGHLVFSTLHTNDAPGALVRLDNMGVEPFLVTSTLLLVVSQRLMRKICASCSEPYSPAPELLEAMGIQNLPEGAVFYRGRGCPECSNTGYRGRVGVYEVLEITEPVKAMILKGMTSSQIKSGLREKGFRTLRNSAMDVVMQGKTTFEELARISTEDSLAEA